MDDDDSEDGADGTEVMIMNTNLGCHSQQWMKH